MEHYPLRVYWEDTDAGGIVYYANYLKFAERARTEALRAAGIEQSTLKERHGITIVVRRCEVDFLAPARLDDLLEVETQLQTIRKVRMTMQQVIRKATQELARLQVELACWDDALKPVRWPEEVVTALGK